MNRDYVNKLKRNYQIKLKLFPSSSEVKLKKILRLLGIKFIFQKRVEYYFYDFFFKNKKLLVEIDGPSHSEESQKIRDKEKELLAKKHGFKLIRFTNDQVWNDINTVIKKIKE